MDQRAQVSCGSGPWMNGSFDSAQPKEAGRQHIARLGIFFFFPPLSFCRENISKSEEEMV